MKHYDYEWDLGPYGIILDQELNTDKLGWQGGDYFKLVNINGTQLLKKVDPIEVFAKGHKVNE
jgi:hypothetical protein